MKNFLPSIGPVTVKFLRYQPMPPGKEPPLLVAGLVGLNWPSMLQSCGRSRLLQLLSLKEGCSAWLTSPKLNFQSLSKLTRPEGWAMVAKQEMRMRQEMRVRMVSV